MLTLPPYKQYDDATIYPDDSSWSTFYYIPNLPRLRYDDKGNPVFLFLKYREDASTLKDGQSRGGGYLQFDCVLDVTDDRRKAITDDLQSVVNKLAQQMGISQPPPVTLAPALYTDVDGTSKVSLITMQPKPDGTGMVTSIAGFGKPSLLGDNIASFAMELSQRGASLMWAACQMDTLPFAVGYDLKFMASMPAIQMHVWMYAGQMHQYSEQVTKDVDSSVWGDTDESYTDTVREVFSKYDFSGVTVNTFNVGGAGSADLQKLANDMAQQGWGIIEDQLKNAMTDKFDPTKDADKGAAGDFQSTFRDYMQSTSTDIDISYTQKQTLPWPIHPQASMTGFMTTPGPNGKLPNKADLFKEINLDDDFFKLLQVRIHCNANFKDDPVYSVKVHMTYGSYTQDFLFTDSTSTQTFQQFVDQNLGRKYQYWTEVNYKNSDKVLKTPEVTTDETELVLSVDDMGYLKTDIWAGSFNWDVVDSAQVHIRYSDDSNGVPLAEDVLLLNATQRTTAYQRTIFAPVVNPYEYMVEFFLKDGQHIQYDWQQSRTLLLLINDMFEDHLAVTFVASGSFDSIDKIVVDVDYEDTAHAYHSQNTFELTQGADTKPWIVPLWKGAARQFRYRSLVVYKDGHSDQGDWISKDGSMTIVVGEVFAASLQVQCMTDLIDFTKVKLVKVSAHYVDAANAIDETEDFVFTAAKTTASPWVLPIKNVTQKGYTYNATFYMTDGTQASIPDTKTTDGTIILQLPAQAPAT
jgi:hypothetical protein